MSNIKRKVYVRKDGYKEVAINYRKARAAILDAKKVGHRSGRIVCPMVEASRNKSFYPEMLLGETTSKGIEIWSEALQIDSQLVKAIAFLSGPLVNAPRNVIRGHFDDQKINNGFIHTLKRGVHTGILGRGTFSQAHLNTFVWSFRPDLEGISMTNKWLYSEMADDLFLDLSHLDIILEHNKNNAPSEQIGVGLKMNRFEMEDLLLGVLGQPITQEKKVKNTVQSILVRDIHDLYKYGILPAHVENKLKAANLLSFPSVQRLVI